MNRALEDHLIAGAPRSDLSPWERVQLIRQRQANSMEYSLPAPDRQVTPARHLGSKVPGQPDPDSPQDAGALARHREALGRLRRQPGIDSYGGQGARR